MCGSKIPFSKQTVCALGIICWLSAGCDGGLEIVNSSEVTASQMAARFEVTDYGNGALQAKVYLTLTWDKYPEGGGVSWE
ncbi:MAG: hypothetical protein V1754_12970, partial [Pseudomonadota bacterium]